MTTGKHEAQLARERAALGDAILDTKGDRLVALTSSLSESDFLSSLHGRTFVAIKRLVSRSVFPLDYSCVIAELLDMGVFKGFDGAYAFVSSLGEGIRDVVPMSKRIAELNRGIEERKSRKRLEAMIGRG